MEDKDFWLFYITADPSEARLVDLLGIDFIMVDLEIEGKELRQKARDTVISKHTIKDVEKVRIVLRNEKLLVRLDPISSKSENQINQAIEAGADALMLPMYRSLEEVTYFVNIVKSRSKIFLLTETLEALKITKAVAAMPEVDYVHFGLNDLHIEMEFKFMFEILSHGKLDLAASYLVENNKRFGIGGIGRIGGDSKIRAELILQEHARVGSRGAILSREYRELFRNLEKDGIIKVKKEIKELREIISKIDRKRIEYGNQPSKLLIHEVEKIVKSVDRH